MKVSWVLLTYERAELVTKCLEYNMNNAGADWDEFIWVDNGSRQVQEVPAMIDVDVMIRNRENLGVAKGYNRGFAMATGDYVVITGCDREMPDNWLLEMKKCVEKTHAKCVSMYSQPIQVVPERKRGEPFESHGYNLIKAMPFGARMFSRELLKLAGYLPEDFGKYGYEDIAWSEAVMRVCDKRHWDYLAMLDHVPRHIGDEGVNGYSGFDPKEYWEFKMKEVKDKAKEQHLSELQKQGWPAHFPY